MKWLLLFVLFVACGVGLCAEEPAFTVENKMPVFAVVNKMPRAVKSDVPAKNYVPDLPKGAVEYKSARFTQRISELSTNGGPFLPTIAPFRILDHSDRRWHQPGGLEGVDRSLWEAKKYRTLPENRPVRRWVDFIEVQNSIPVTRAVYDPLRRQYVSVQVTDEKGEPVFHKQKTRGLLRAYPDGTQFDEVLVNKQTGKVFEHRKRVKDGGKWEGEVVHRDPAEFPKGYTGLKVSCASCHDEAGTGKYADGLVPGGDGVFSDPLPWELWLARSPEAETPPEAPKMAPPTAPACTCKPAPGGVGTCGSYNCPANGGRGGCPCTAPPQALPASPPVYYVPRGRQACPT